MDHKIKTSSAPRPVVSVSTQQLQPQCSVVREVEEPVTVVVLPYIQDVIACQFSSWYPTFSNLPVQYNRRKNVTIKSIIISPLPDTFRDYLLSDQLILPSNTRTSSALLEAHQVNNNSSADTTDLDPWSSDDEDVCNGQSKGAGSDDESVSVPHQFSFPLLNEQIDNAIKSFSNQACIPKLNWSAPKDALWVNGGTSMECRFAGDVYLLLKASDFCSFDVQHAMQDVIDTDPIYDEIQLDRPLQSSTKQSLQLELVLRKWCNLYPSQEFRCFVVHQHLIGISQRYHSHHWPYLLSCREQYQNIIFDPMWYLQ
jgi:D123